MQPGLRPARDFFGSQIWSQTRCFYLDTSTRLKQLVGDGDTVVECGLDTGCVSVLHVVIVTKYKIRGCPLYRDKIWSILDAVISWSHL